MNGRKICGIEVRGNGGRSGAIAVGDKSGKIVGRLPHGKNDLKFALRGGSGCIVPDDTDAEESDDPWTTTRTFCTLMCQKSWCLPRMNVVRCSLLTQLHMKCSMMWMLVRMGISVVVETKMCLAPEEVQVGVDVWVMYPPITGWVTRLASQMQPW